MPIGAVKGNQKKRGKSTTIKKDNLPISTIPSTQEDKDLADHQTQSGRRTSNARKTKAGTQRSGKGGKAKSRKQAIAIGLSKARKKGAKVPQKKKSP